MTARQRWSLVAVYAAAMAFVESAVVTYLRVFLDRVDPYQPYPLSGPTWLAGIEIAREAATLIMLIAVGWLAGRTLRSRVGYTMVAFGLWDILYYAFLRGLSGWPRSLADWDILFLIPLPWWGPVWAPMSIAGLMAAGGTLLVRSGQGTGTLWPGRSAWPACVAGMLLALYVFMADAIRVAPDGEEALRRMLPTWFNWPVFLAALLLMALPLLDIAWQRCKRGHATIGVVLFCLAGVTAPASALDLPIAVIDAPGYTLTLGSRAWISQGKSAHNIAGLNGRPNVVSELTYNGLNSPITQLSADLVVRHVPVLNRVVAGVTGGYGGIGSGTLLDQDWVGNSRTQPVSETLSHVTDGHVAHVSVDAGWRPLEWRFMDNPLPGAVDLVLGYQFWQEKYDSTGVIAGGVAINARPAISQTNTWNSFRLGARTVIPVHSYVALRGQAFLIPWTHYESEDIHYQRAGLAKDPSFLTIATGGLGVQLEGSLVVRLWRRVAAEAGYAYWDIRSGSGTVEAFQAGGGSVVVPFNQENTRRQGVFFGLNYVY
jgi:hypothetical protein